jgi:hypothetical protein
MAQTGCDRQPEKSLPVNDNEEIRTSMIVNEPPEVSFVLPEAPWITGG